MSMIGNWWSISDGQDMENQLTIQHSECICIMSADKNVNIACVFKCENMVWGWGRVSEAWIGVSQKVREMSGNLTLPGPW